MSEIDWRERAKFTAIVFWHIATAAVSFVLSLYAVVVWEGIVRWMAVPLLVFSLVMLSMWTAFGMTSEGQP